MFALKTSCENFDNCVFPNAMIAGDCVITHLLGRLDYLKTGKCKVMVVDTFHLFDETMPFLAEKIAELLALIPQLSLVSLVADIIEMLILYFKGIRNQILRQLAYYLRILDAELAATRPGNIALARVLPCALEDFDQLLNWQNSSATPINRLIGVVNVFLEIIGLGKLGIPLYAPPTSALNLTQEDFEKSVILIDKTIELLVYVRLAIPEPPTQELIGDLLETLGFTE